MLNGEDVAAHNARDDCWIIVKDAVITTSSDFTIKLADYGLSNAGGKLADEPKISVQADFK